jgi:hypothetical protein
MAEDLATGPRTVLPALASEDYTCATCGIDYPTTTIAAALETITGLPARIRDEVQGLPDEILRSRPKPDVWSPMEYLCHV